MLPLDAMTTAEALLHESGCGRIECTRNPSSSDADRLWAPKFKHAVQCIDGNGDLCPATLIRP
jgi:hypothetical protein